MRPEPLPTGLAPVARFAGGIVTGGSVPTALLRLVTEVPRLGSIPVDATGGGLVTLPRAATGGTVEMRAGRSCSPLGGGVVILERRIGGAVETRALAGSVGGGSVSRLATPL
jgi:hypothetical protein